MPPLDSAGSSLRFGLFEADLRTAELRREGRKVPLQEQPFQVLAVLLEKPGALVTREELRQRLWPGDVFVDFEQGLNNAVKKLRTALDDSAESPRYVETLARRGYRFIAPVSLEPSAPARPARSAPRVLGTPLVMGVAVALALLLARSERCTPPGQPADRTTLAVLPFENLSGDAEQEYFSDGMTEELISRLGGLDPGRVAVIGRASAMHYKGTRKRVDEIGRELSVDYVITGSVRRSGAQLRITGALVRVRDQLQVWSGSYDREVSDALRIQAEVVSAIAREVLAPLAPRDRPPPTLPRLVHPEAYDAHLRGLYLWNQFTAEAARRAIRSFEAAIQKDPSFAPAYAGFASAYHILVALGDLSPDDVPPRAREALDRAVELDPESADVLDKVGWFKLESEWDFAGAEAAFRRALELNPNLGTARTGYGSYLAAAGRPDEALAELRRARAVDPMSLIVNAELGLKLYYARQYEAAAEQCLKVLELDPGFPPPHLVLRHVYYGQQRYEDFVEADLASIRLTLGEKAPDLEAERRIAKRSGWEGYLRYRIEQMTTRQAHEGGLAFPIAVAWARLGDQPAALDWLERSLDERAFRLAYLNADPLWDPFRAEPRFQAITRRVGLPGPASSAATP